MALRRRMFSPGDESLPPETTFDEFPDDFAGPDDFDAPTIDTAPVPSANGPSTPGPAPARHGAAPGLFPGLVALGLIGGGAAMFGLLLLAAIGTAIYVNAAPTGDTPTMASEPAEAPALP